MEERLIYPDAVESVEEWATLRQELGATTALVPLKMAMAII